MNQEALSLRQRIALLLAAGVFPALRLPPPQGLAVCAAAGFVLLPLRGAARLAAGILGLAALWAAAPVCARQIAEAAYGGTQQLPVLAVLLLFAGALSFCRSVTLGRLGELLAVPLGLGLVLSACGVLPGAAGMAAELPGTVLSLGVLLHPTGSFLRRRAVPALRL